MPNVVERLKITEVALCPDGMNQEAKMVLFKSKDSPEVILPEGGDPKHNEGGEEKLTLFERIRRVFKGDLNEELERTEARRRFWDVVDAFYDSVYSVLHNEDISESEKAETLSRTADQLASHMKDLAPKMVVKENGGGNQVPQSRTWDDVFKSLPEEDQAIATAYIESLAKEAPEDEPQLDLPEHLRKQWEEMQQTNRMLKDRQQRADIAERVKDLSKVADVDSLVSLIKEIEDVQPVQKDSEVPTLAKRLEEVLRTANERISQGGLFKEFGNQTSGPTNASDALDKAVEAIRKDNPNMSYAEALDLAVQKDASLYQQYLQEREG